MICSGITQNAYPGLPEGTMNQLPATSEVPLEKAIEGDLVFFYGKGSHVGTITNVKRDANGKLTEFEFGHTTESLGARIDTAKAPAGKDKKGSYWFRNMHSIRTFNPGTDPAGPNSTMDKINNFFKKIFK